MRVLIAGVGNVFLGDDGFGVEVAAELAGRRLPAGVESSDYGIRGVHLAYQLLDGYDGLILVDAVELGEAPGTVAVIEPAGMPAAGGVDAHSMDPATVLATLAALGGQLERVLVVGCQPAAVEERMGLSAQVAASVVAAADEAVRLAVDLLGPGSSVT